MKKMKKFIVVLMAVMMFLLVACGNQKDSDGGKTSGNKAGWMDGKLVFEGKEMQLPCKFSELEAMGWKLKEGTEISDAIVYGPEVVYLENDKYETFINAGLYTDKQEKVSASECDVISIIVNGFMGDSEYYPSISIDGLTMGDSKEKMIEVLGEPDESNEDTASPSYTYEKMEGKMRYCVNVHFMDGKIYMMGIVAQPTAR